MKKIIIMMVFVCVLILVGCGDEEVYVVQNHFESETLEEFYDEVFVGIMERDPEYIDFLGDLSEYGVEFEKDLLTINSTEYQAEMETYYKDALIYLKAFNIKSGDE